ncbi:AAA family ATPase [Nocardia terpenica]|uniref:AAA family ATPase n=1 Tax=Nocardia terpenica TaxID=455432 RepID=UPI00189398BC|nr:AAA family ATPase [Nocardia terpenica]MBF6062838.1 AAA family ATPase [Nocardia terpenica]MBF6105027.1 AAA family ATPase [Nocardia terpenica]MBF6112536.1 AAA family ATPase [Nocardia terpenica]MBF6118755.1 AAA family ATPase [Nocardia terpenica]MBF6154224.1 AAA family ATPase [Nocardia terpenica]
MAIEFKPAVRRKSKARLALAGPSGSGKTYTALALAWEWAAREQGVVGMVDTEHGSARKYQGLNGWEWQTLEPDRFSPASLVEILGVAAGHGFAVMVIDSWSHYWMGQDGMLEQVDRRKLGSNSFSGWKEANPDERRMLEAMLSFPGHLIVTMRTKTEYVIEEDNKGRAVPRKVGTRPVQREGLEHEFDIVGDLDLKNNLHISKTRLPFLAGQVIAEPGAELAGRIADWLDGGEEIPTVAQFRRRILDVESMGELQAIWKEIDSYRLLGAPTVDLEGVPTTLRYLIIAIKEAMEAVDRRTAAGTDASAEGRG